MSTRPQASTVPRPRSGAIVHEAPPFTSADPEIARFADVEIDARGMTPRTREAYQRDLEHFGSFLKSRAAGTSPDEKLAPPYDGLVGAQYADVLAYQQYLRSSRRYAPRSLRRKIATLRSFYKYLRRVGRRDDNPAADAILPKIGKPLPKAMNVGEVAKVFEISIAGLTDLQRRRDRAILQCLWSCGVRRAELVGLDLTDVDLDARQLRVIKGKGQKDRYVPMTPEAATAMRAYLDVRPAVSVPAFFVGRGNRRLSAASVYKIVRTYMQLAGIEDHASPHTWRHTVATVMRARGADLLFLKEFLGHESTATTEIYTKLAGDQLRKEFDRFHPRDDLES